MNPGDLSKRITLQQKTMTPDTMGGFTESWVDVGSVYAAIWPIKATEQIQAGQITMLITHRIRIRYRRVMRSSWRISWGGRYYDIISIIDMNMAHRWIDILCKEASA